MYVCETIYLCMCVRLHLCMCVRLYIYACVWDYNAKCHTLWNEEMPKIKVVDLDEFYNFYIHHLFSWNYLVFENLVRSCYFLKFKTWIVQSLSQENVTQMKVEDLDEFYNFYSWNHLLVEIRVWSCYFLKFKIWII